MLLVFFQSNHVPRLNNAKTYLSTFVLAFYHLPFNPRDKFSIAKLKKQINCQNLINISKFVHN